MIERLLRAKWRLFHVAVLALAEWFIAHGLLLSLNRAWVGGLHTHPLGSDAIFAEDGRVALDVTLAHLVDLRAGLVFVVIGMAIVFFVSVPLHGVTAVIARKTDENPWTQSVLQSPRLVAIAALQWVSFALIAYGLVRTSGPMVRAVMAGAGARSFVLPSVIALGLVYLLQCTRVCAHHARLLAVAEAPLRGCLAGGLRGLQNAPFRTVFTLSLVDLTMILLSVLTSVCPSVVLWLLSLVTQFLRVQMLVWWLAAQHRRAPV